MSKVKAKYLSSKKNDREGVIVYQFLYKKKKHQLKTELNIHKEDWMELQFSQNDTSYHRFLVRKKILYDCERLNNIIFSYEKEKSNYSFIDVINEFKRQTIELSFYNFMKQLINELNIMRKYRTSETYTSALNSFSTFLDHHDILLNEIDSDTIQVYESFLKNRGLVKNSTSFYMRILRAVYNKAVEKDLTQQKNPFRHVYTGIDKTSKRAISLDSIKRIKALNLDKDSKISVARDLFLFSFYTRGMSFVDIAYLKKSNLHNGTLTYYRHKTGQRLCIHWEKCMQEIVDKYTENSKDYLLPILKEENKDNYYLYRRKAAETNKQLKRISNILDLKMNLTFYVARHSWASIAKSKNIPVSVISKGMGHESETTTLIYLASLENSIVDKANRMILKSL